jgi:DNA-binding NarL/FixJ family response regulator
MNIKKIAIIYDLNNSLDRLVGVLTEQSEYQITNVIHLKNLHSMGEGKFDQEDFDILIYCLKNAKNTQFYNIFRANFSSLKGKRFVLISDSVYVKMMNFLIVEGFRSFIEYNFTKEQCLNALNYAFNGSIYMDAHHTEFIIKGLAEINKFQVDAELAIIDFAIEHNLNHRESNIIALLNQNKTYNEIGFKLFISTDTVRFYIKRIYKQFNVHSKNDLISLIMNEFEVKSTHIALSR